MKLNEITSILESLDFVEPHDNIPGEIDYVYHATNDENLYDIIHSGVIDTHDPYDFTDQETWPDGAEEPRSYFSDNASVVWSFAPEHGRPVILRVPKKVANFRRESGTGDMYLTQALSANHVEVLTKSGWVPIIDL